MMPSGLPGFSRPPGKPGGERKIDLGSQWLPDSHRSGWRYAMDALACLHAPGGVVLEGFIEKKFAWGGDPGDLRNDPRPHTRPWVGFWHNPPTVHDSFNRVGHAPGDILAGELWQESAPHCRGLFTLSRHLKRWLEARVQMPVCSLLHPTELPAITFSPRRYAANPHKKLIQVGWWLRRVESVWDLDVPSLEKVVLNPFPATSYQHSAEGWADYGRSADVIQLAYQDNRAYDELLAENIVFLDLYDSGANNAIVECIARQTPVLVNPLPAVIEYLGDDYPFYFTDLDEAARKAATIQTVVAAHQYLRDSPVRRKLTADWFRQQFVRSSIYQDLPGPSTPQARAPVPVPAQARTQAPGRPQEPRKPQAPRAPRPPAAPLRAQPSTRASTPAVTIFTSVYAADRDLPQFLANICGQAAFGACELLLFDVRPSHRDPDAVRDLISAYRATHPNIRYRALDVDPGLYQIWNMAVQASNAPLLSNANIDDRKAPHAVERHLGALRTHAGIDVVCGALLVTTTPHQTWESNTAARVWFAKFRNGNSDISSLGSRTEFGLGDLFLHDASGRRIGSHNLPHCMPMWRKTLHERYGLFNPWDFAAIADWEFWLRCAAGGARFMLLRERLGLYYRNPWSHNMRLRDDSATERVMDMHREPSYA
jgi:hypothetical protein